MSGLAASGRRMTTRPLTASRRTNAVPTSALARTSRTTPGVPGPSPDAASSCSPPTPGRAHGPPDLRQASPGEDTPGHPQPHGGADHPRLRAAASLPRLPRHPLGWRAAPARRDVSAGAILTRLACASTSAWATGPRTATCPCPPPPGAVTPRLGHPLALLQDLPRSGARRNGDGNRDQPQAPIKGARPSERPCGSAASPRGRASTPCDTPGRLIGSRRGSTCASSTRLWAITPRHDSARPPSDPPGAREGWRGPPPSHGGSVMVALAAICRTHGPASRATCTDQRRPSHGRAWKPSHPAGQTRVALMSRAVHTAKLTSLAISPATTAIVPPASTALPMRGGNGHRSCACRSPLSWAPLPGPRPGGHWPAATTSASTTPAAALPQQPSNRAPTLPGLSAARAG